MSKRLDITLFGTFYVVGALHLTPQAVRAGVTAFGKKQWQKTVTDIALGGSTVALGKRVAHTIGHPVPLVYEARGIALHDDRFGLESFLGGRHAPMAVMGAENRTLQPGALMRDYKSGDMLGVFRASRLGALHFRWDVGETVHPEEVVLTYDTATALLPDLGTFELALDVTWNGQAGRRQESGSEPLADIRQVIHKKN